jgi:hypothetical protein
LGNGPRCRVDSDLFQGFVAWDLIIDIGRVQVGTGIGKEEGLMWEYVDNGAGKDFVSGFESGHFIGISSFLLCCPPHDSLQCLLLPLHVFWIENMAWWH